MLICFALLLLAYIKSRGLLNSFVTGELTFCQLLAQPKNSLWYYKQNQSSNFMMYCSQFHFSCCSHMRFALSMLVTQLKFALLNRSVALSNFKNEAMISEGIEWTPTLQLHNHYCVFYINSYLIRVLLQRCSLL